MSEIQLYEMVMKLYPWVLEADARRIAHEAETKRNDHMFEESRKLKPKDDRLYGEYTNALGGMCLG